MSSPQDDITRNFVGAWSLFSWTATSPDGEVRHPYGQDAVGRIQYSADGKMVACLMRRFRERFRSDNRHDASIEERDAAYHDYMSYFGSFTIQQDERTVTHHVEGATFPNWIGTDLVRSFHFENDQLTLSLIGPGEVAYALTWERASDVPP